MAILHELKRNNAFQNIQLRKMLKMEKRISNIEKTFDALHKSIGLETLSKSIADAGLEPIPENPEAERQAEIEIEQEIINIDNRDNYVIDGQDDLIKELYSNVSYPNPDDSLIITEEKDLTPAQKASKDRYDQIADEVSKNKHHFEIPEGGWSYEKYLELVDHVQEGNLTEIGAPTSQENFRKRYKKSWDPKMTRLADFDIPRSKTRCTKPRDWEIRVDRENKLLDSVKNVKKEPEEKEDENYEAPSTSKKRKRVFTEDSPRGSDKDEVFDDSEEDFQVEKENPKKKAKNKHDLPKKTKAKPKPPTISQQIVR